MISSIRILLLLTVAWILGHGFVYWEWGEQLGVLPVSDFYYQWTGEFTRAIQAVVEALIMLTLIKGYPVTQYRLATETPIRLYLWFCVLDCGQMIYFNPEHYNSFYSEVICLSIAATWTVFEYRRARERLIEEDKKKLRDIM